MKHMLLISTLLAILQCSVVTYQSHGQDFLDLDEPAWIYRARGDRYYRERDFGNALAHYKKALLKKKRETIYPRLNGIDIELGLSRVDGNIELYSQLLYYFLLNHEESSAVIYTALQNRRYEHVRELLLHLAQDAYMIGADAIYEAAHELEQSILKKNRELWDYQLRQLAASVAVALETLRSLSVEFSDDQNRGEKARLILPEMPQTSYPEVYLGMARIYREEGLYALALQYAERAEMGADYLEIPDMIFDIYYLKADIYRDLNRLRDYEEQLRKIVDRDRNWKSEGDRPLGRIPNNVVKSIAEDVAAHAVFGRAYYRLGELAYNSGRDASAEPYLKMALLYGHEYEKTREYLTEYYTSINDLPGLKKIEDIDALLR
jgi:HPt (histidine-containing phosphotransfer) domain-containing protein